MKIRRSPRCREATAFSCPVASLSGVPARYDALGRERVRDSYGDVIDRAEAFGGKVVVIDIAGMIVPAAIADAADLWRGSDGATYREKIKRFIKWVVGSLATGAKAVYIVFDGASFPLKANTHAARRKTPEARAEIERQARAHDDAGRFAAGAKKWRELGYPIRAAVYDWLISWCRVRAAK